MKLNVNQTSFAVLVATITVISVSCIDSDKDFYDPDYRAKNPMGDIIAPEGFDWQLSTTVNLTVNAHDEFDGQYYYIIDVFDENPALSAKANLLSKGVAKKGEAFTTKLSISQTTSTLFIRQTSPNGLASIRAYETQSKTIDCNFENTIPPTTRSFGNTRAFVNMEAPDEDDRNIFPESAPTQSTLFNQGNFKANQSYRVTAATTKIDLGGSANIELYVTENVTLTEQIYLTSRSKLYILPGVTLTMPQAANNGQSGCLISIGKDAAFIVKQGKIQLDSDYKFYNLGTVEASEFICTNSSFFYNKGAANITKKLSGENSGSNLLNEGNLTTQSISIAGNSHLINRGKVTVAEATTLNCKAGLWANEGEWTTKEMKVSAWNDFSINKCKLIVTQLLELREAKLINDGGAYIQCKELYMNNTLVELGAKSFIDVTEQAQYGYQNKAQGFKGTGTEKALLQIKKAVAEQLTNDLIHYAGNLLIVCDDHPVSKKDDWNIYWTLSNGAEWANEATKPLEIKKTECNEGSGITPTPPADPDFPVIVEPGSTYALMFEDQWPLYGDYDMNDIVMEFKKMKYELNNKNRTNKVSFTITLQAVGATRVIAAAVMLDEIQASAISRIEYGKNSTRPVAFNTTGAGIEAEQTLAVIPIFDDAHRLMNKKTREFVNTLSGSSNNLKESDLPEIEITIHLNQAVAENNFNMNNMNFFIITDRAKLRKEVHMAGYHPSNLVNPQYFGNNDDQSKNERYYVSKENLAWGIIVPQQFKWPLEYHNIKDVYSAFEGWVTSGGTENKNWWNQYHVNGIFQNNSN